MTAVAAFKLTSPVTQAAAPFMIGHVFAKGDIPAGQYAELDLANFVVQPLKFWNDGSLKTAALIGRVGLTANTAKQVNVVKRSTAPVVGTLLTAASIQTAAPTASIQFGSFGTVSLAGLLASPVRTYISTKEMVECHYKAACGSDPSLVGEFHVRLWVDGRMRVRAIGSNGFLNGTEAVQKDYIPTVTIGGVVVWNNGGVAYKHSRFAAWDRLGWIGTNPQVTPQHDTGYMTLAKLVPNIWKKNPAQSIINSYGAMTYTPGANLDFTPNMGNSGFQNDLGLLPLWDALYCTTGANPSMYKAVIEHASAIRSYAITIIDTSTLKPAKISDFPRWSIYGLNEGGASRLDTVAQDGSALVYEKNHSTSSAYVAALISADYYHIETCCLNAIATYFCADINVGDGVLRGVAGEVRGRSWAYRNYSQAAAIIPNNLASLFGDIPTLFKNLAASRVAYYVTPSYPGKWLGYEDLYGNRNNSTGRSRNGQMAISTAPWETHFGVASLGMAYDIEPCDAAGMASLAQWIGWAQQAPVWLCGGTSANEFNFGHADTYEVDFRANQAIPSEGVPLGIKDYVITADGGMVFNDTIGYASDGTTTVPNAVAVTYNAANPGTTKLIGNAVGSTSSSTLYFANMMPALAYAVDHSQPGASAAWTRFTNASNFSEQDVLANYADTPIWGIVPRSYIAPAVLFTAVDSGTGTIVTTPGPSIRCEAIPQHTAGLIVTAQPGIGTPGSQFAGVVTGADGTTPIYDAKIAAGGSFNNLSEYRSVSSSPNLFISDVDQSQIYTGNGSYESITLANYEDGAAIASSTENFGTPTDATIPVMSSSITSSAITTSGFTLSWSAASDNVGVTGYEVSTDGGSTYVNAGNVLTVAKTGLTASTAYSVRVRAYDAAGNKATPLSASVSTSAAADSTAPTMQGSLTVSLITNTGFTIGWIAASDNVAVTGYELSTDNGSTYTNVGNVLSYACTGKTANTLYNVKVRAYDAASNRSVALSTTATTTAIADSTAPSLTGSITVTNITTGGFTAAWPSATDNVGVAGYEISIDSGTPAYVSVGNVLTSVKTGLASATQFNIRVRAYDAAGNRSAALTTTVTTATAGTYATSVTLTFQDRSNTLKANLTGMKWAFFDQTTPNNLSAPSAKGTLATTNSSGVAVLNITGTTLPPGATGWLIFSNSDGTATQSNLISFAGPCVTA